MNKILATASVVALSTMVASSAMAATIIIDNFNTQQRVEDLPSTSFPNTSTVTSGTFLGDSRTMTVETDPVVGSNPVGGTVFESTGPTGLPSENRLQFSNIDGQQGRATIEYSFASEFDLTDNFTNDRFFFVVTSFDQSGAASFSATVTGGGVTGTYSELLGPGFDPFLAFSDPDFTGVDFTKVTSLAFGITASSDSFDGSLGSISVVPLPASALLLLGGLGGLAAFKRRRRRTA